MIFGHVPLSRQRRIKPSVLPVTVSVVIGQAKGNLYSGYQRDVLAMRAEGLSETVIGENAAASADPIEHAIHRLARFALSIRALWRIGILIEAERHEI